MVKMSVSNNSGKNYTYYNADIVLPRVKSFSSPTPPQENDVSVGDKSFEETTTSSEVDVFKRENDSLNRSGFYETPVDIVGAAALPNNNGNDQKPLFIPCPPTKEKPHGKIIRAQIHIKKLSSNENSEDNQLVFHNRLPSLENEKVENRNGSSEETFHYDGSSKAKKYEHDNGNYKHTSTPRETDKQASKESFKQNISRDQKLINQYKDFLNQRFHDSSSPENSNEEDDDISISVSSLSSEEDDNDTDNLATKTLTGSSFEPLYSLPIKDKKTDKALNKILISNSNVTGHHRGTGSLPDLRSIENVTIQKVSHVAKNDSEAESEPGAKIGYKFRPLPPIPGTSSNINNTRLYETIDGLSHLQRSVAKGNDTNKRKTFKDIANILTLIPRLTTNSVRSRKNDHTLADISQYLPDKKLKIFVGTWNMKGTKFLPASLDDFLLPPESIYLQDVYVIGTQEGTPFRREWQVRLQETFGPSHVLMQSSNFGVLQLSIFVRRELVWFCSNVEQDTIATRVGHKIKTKGALAMSFSVFGTSLLFITSHFTSDKEKLRDRINDYRTICRNLHLPFNDTKSEGDVTDRFDRVFWFGDFNFRIKKSREVVDRMLKRYSSNRDVVIRDLLQHDQLNELFFKGKIFHGFTENQINFMPTYKFDVNTDTYDSSSKQRVPSWTDRIVHKSTSRDALICLHYNSCNTIKVSDHRPVYCIFEALVAPYKDNFTVPAATFDREVYVEANLRRNAPSGTQGNSHVCTIL